MTTGMLERENIPVDGHLFVCSEAADAMGMGGMGENR
jgi:hypothetical protein